MEDEDRKVHCKLFFTLKTFKSKDTEENDVTGAFYHLILWLCSRSFYMLFTVGCPSTNQVRLSFVRKSNHLNYIIAQHTNLALAVKSFDIVFSIINCIIRIYQCSSQISYLQFTGLNKNVKKILRSKRKGNATVTRTKSKYAYVRKTYNIPSKGPGLTLIQ